MRQITRDLLAVWRDALPLQDPIVEFGAFQVQAPRDDLRPLFPGRRYVGLDWLAGPGVDGRVDVHALPIRAGSVGTAICVDTLEHIRDPIRAIEQMHRAIRPVGGLLLLVSVFLFQIHHEPDYWRFTPQGFERLLVGPFTSALVLSAGGFKGFPETIAGVGATEDVDLTVVEPA